MGTELPTTAAADARARALRFKERYAAWLRDVALPRWAREGCDRVHGGFHERVGADGPMDADARRARVQVRQVYAFANAPALGWSGDPEPLVRGGLQHFFARYRRGDGLYRTLCAADGTPLDERAYLYDQAFVLLALAEAQRRLGPAPGLTEGAEALLATLRRLLKRPGLGFYSGIPARLPLLANPHMHLLEAALAWREVSGAPMWQGLVVELTELALARLIDPGSGALLESFAEDWQRLRTPEGRIIEPGHLFEWGWLLQRCGTADAQAAAARLLALAEQHGVRAGVALNALLDDFSVHDSEARLWPQTERLKAQARLAASNPASWTAVAEAGEALMRYIDPAPEGLWLDRLRPDGTLKAEPAPASSFYHLVAAGLELERAFGPGR